MKLVSFQYRGQVRAGLWLGTEALDLQHALELRQLGGDLSSVLAIVRGGTPALQLIAELERELPALAAARRPAHELQLLAPIPAPARNVFCVGRNYLDHVREGYAASGADTQLPKAPQFFTKATHTVCGPGAAVRLDPGVTSKLDYEVELALVIGKGGRDIAPDRAFEHVFGYTVANDITARDLQRRHDQWFKGKSLDDTLPLGPWLVDRDSLGDPATLELSLEVNGEPRQRAQVAQMIFDIPTLIAQLSAGLTLDAGDIVITGTPAGVGFAMEPPRYLKPGDRVVARIDRIGELSNTITGP
ncbi:MAG TPA: fumarylacetoacetate hydrolase family protein [Steroidobacteraceae bacterium]|nr:fumarylacetoacetate hydrolase family protein [Steroidobacteraceae bacterium]